MNFPPVVKTVQRVLKLGRLITSRVNRSATNLGAVALLHTLAVVADFRASRAAGNPRRCNHIALTLEVPSVLWQQNAAI